MVTMRQLGHRFAYIVKLYPDETVHELISRMEMPPVNVNVSIWTAVDLGLISELDPETEKFTFLKEPRVWDLGDMVTFLQDTLEYSFRKLAEKENDLEENYLGNWMTGYGSADIDIAIDRLLTATRLARYEIVDGENTYLFYCLPEHVNKQWGQKQFKTKPSEVDPDDAPIIPEADTASTQEAADDTRASGKK